MTKILRGTHQWIHNIDSFDGESAKGRFKDVTRWKSREVSMLGKRGGGYIFDTNVIHKAECEGFMERTSIMLEFNKRIKSSKIKALSIHNIPCPSKIFHVTPSQVQRNKFSSKLLRKNDCVLEVDPALNCRPIEALPIKDWRRAINNGKKSFNDFHGWLPEEKVTYKGNRILDERTFSNYIYLDLGANYYVSSIGNWFLKSYPQAKKFRITAFETEAKYIASYIGSNVELINMAVWIENTTISSTKISDDNYPYSIRNTIDFADYLFRKVKESDYLVIKMALECAEYDIIPDLIARNATHLIDEMFIKVHTDVDSCCMYRKDRSYSDARKLIRLLRDYGVYAHMWGG